MDESTSRLNPSPRVTTFLNALPHAADDEFVRVPGMATWRAKHVRRALEREVLVVHSTGFGFTFLQPPGHVGMCPHCAAHKGSLCDHCACAMCSWIRQSDERASPLVSRAKLLQLVARMRAFTFAGGATAPAPELDADL